MKIAGAGIACLDHILIAPQIRWGETARVEDYQVQGGGLVGTALVACARLGAECRLYSFLGDDEIGDRIASGLKAEGIDVSGIKRVRGGASPFSVVHVDSRSAERTIFHRQAEGMERIKLPALRGIARDDVLLVDDYYPKFALAAARTAKAKGIPVVADVTINPKKDPALFRNVDVLIAPRSFAAQIGFADNLAGALKAIHRLGPEIAVITLGREGWISSSPQGCGKGKAFKVKVVDTTGAGDAFHGAFAYGLGRKWMVERCAEFAAAVAAIKCTRPGGRAGLPSLSQTINFLKKKGRLDWSGIMAKED